MSKSVYCVWKDNFLEEYFALEKADFDSQQNLIKALQNEKCVFHEVEAESFKEAIKIHKDSLAEKFNLEKEPNDSLDNHHFSLPSNNSKNLVH